MGGVCVGPGDGNAHGERLEVALIKGCRRWWFQQRLSCDILIELHFCGCLTPYLCMAIKLPRVGRLAAGVIKAPRSRASF